MLPNCCVDKLVNDKTTSPLMRKNTLCKHRQQKQRTSRYLWLCTYPNGCPQPAPGQHGPVLPRLVSKTALAEAWSEGLELTAHGVGVFQHWYHQPQGGLLVVGAALVSPKPFRVVRPFRGEREGRTVVRSCGDTTMYHVSYINHVSHRGGCMSRDPSVRWICRAIKRCCILCSRNFPLPLERHGLQVQVAHRSRGDVLHSVSHSIRGI